MAWTWPTKSAPGVAGGVPKIRRDSGQGRDASLWSAGLIDAVCTRTIVWMPDLGIGGRLAAGFRWIVWKNFGGVDSAARCVFGSNAEVIALEDGGSISMQIVEPADVRMSGLSCLWEHRCKSSVYAIGKFIR